MTRTVGYGPPPLVGPKGHTCAHDQTDPGSAGLRVRKTALGRDLALKLAHGLVDDKRRLHKLVHTPVEARLLPNIYRVSSREIRKTLSKTAVRHAGDPRLHRQATTQDREPRKTMIRRGYRTWHRQAHQRREERAHARRRNGGEEWTAFGQARPQPRIPLEEVVVLEYLDPGLE